MRLLPQTLLSKPHPDSLRGPASLPPPIPPPIGSLRRLDPIKKKSMLDPDSFKVKNIFILFFVRPTEYGGQLSFPLDTKVKKNLRSGGAFLFFFLLYKADPSFFALYKAKAKISGRLRYKKYRSAYFPKIAPPLPGPPPLFPLFFFCRGCSFFL